MSRYDRFEREVELLINRLSLENDSNTPDFILAKHLRECLEAFVDTSNARERWYGREPSTRETTNLDSSPSDVRGTAVGDESPS